MSQTESRLPDPPPTWRRLLLLPRTLAREARWSAGRRWRSLRWRGRHGHRALLGLARAWAGTDPHDMLRVLEAWQAHPAATSPTSPVQPPPAGAQSRLTGHLSAGGRLGEWTLDERTPLDEAIPGALGLDPRSTGCRVEVTMRVLGEREDDAGQVWVEHSAPTSNTQQRPVTAEQYRRLGEIGALGEGIELIDGYIVSGRFPFAFSGEAIAAARATGINLTSPEFFDGPPTAPAMHDDDLPSAGEGRAAAGRDTTLDNLADELYDLRCELARHDVGEVSYPAERWAPCAPASANWSPLPASGCVRCWVGRTSSRSPPGAPAQARRGGCR